MSRPSNSGIATCIAASIGDNAAPEAAHAARVEVRHSAWITGTSSSASAPTSQASSSPPALASVAAEAPAPPAASTVTISASTPRPAGRRPPGRPAQRPAVHRQRVGAGASTASASVSTKACCRPPRARGRRRCRRSAAPAASRVAVHAGRGQRGGRVEAVPGQQHRVAQEPGELGEVGRAALAQVGERLGRDARRHGRQCHQRGVRGGLAAEHDGGQALREHRVQPGRPGRAARPAAGPRRHQAPSEQGRHVVRFDASGVRGAPPAAGSRREQVGVGRVDSSAASRSVSAVDSKTIIRELPAG